MAGTEEMVFQDGFAEIEALDHCRRRMIAAIVVSVAFWFVPQILQGLWESLLPRPVLVALVALGIAGGLAYMFFMMRFHRLQMRILADPRLDGSLNDERILALRQTAIHRGWVAMLVTMALGLGISFLVEIPDHVILLILLLVAIEVPLLAFLVLDRD